MDSPSILNTCTKPFCNCSTQFEWLQILQSTTRYATIFSFLGQNVCGDFQLTMQGKEMQSHTQTLTEPASAPQQTQSCRITTNQQSKHKMLMEINYPLRAVYFFFYCWIILNKQTYWRAKQQNKCIGWCLPYWYTTQFPRQSAPWATAATTSRAVILLVEFLLTFPNEIKHSPINLIVALFIMFVLVFWSQATAHHNSWVM